MHLHKLLQRALAASSLIFTVKALVFTGELIPRSGKLDTAPSKKWTSGVLERSDAASAALDISLVGSFNRTDLQWFAMIDVGENSIKQQVTVALSTTRTPLIVPATNCTTCNPKAWKFGAANSSTFIPGDGKPTRYNFTTGPDATPLVKPIGATCRRGNDTISVGCLKVESQAFLLCDEFDPILGEMRASGILGLDTYDPSMPEKTLLWNLWESGKLDNPVFSLTIPAGRLKGGRFTLGGLDGTKYTGDIHYMGLQTDVDGMTRGQWIVPHGAAYANGRRLANSTTYPTPLWPAYAVFDTNTAFIQTPDRETAVSVYSQISPEFELIDPAGAWGVPCAEMAKLAPTLTFTFGNGDEARNFTIPARNFNLGEYPAKPGYCQGVFNSPISPVRSPDDKPVWVVGLPFLKAFYSVWRGLDKQIGFADLVNKNLAKPSEAPAPS